MSPQNLQLDAGHSDESLKRLSSAFAALAPGDALTLETVAHPRKLARRFSDAAWGLFDWIPLAESGGRWRVEVRKRGTPPPERISVFLGEDHRRCDEYYAEAEAAALSNDAARAGERFARFELCLLRHMAMEEEGLFPELERRMGFVGDGPTAMMREEHEGLRGLLSRMRECLEAGDLPSFTDVCETMLVLMEQHNMKEEEMLYPMMDEAFAGEEESLLKQLVTY
jgi:hemerythrin superfamily protein